MKKINRVGDVFDHFYPRELKETDGNCQSEA